MLLATEPADYLLRTSLVYCHADDVTGRVEHLPEAVTAPDLVGGLGCPRWCERIRSRKNDSCQSGTLFLLTPDRSLGLALHLRAGSGLFTTRGLTPCFLVGGRPVVLIALPGYNSTTSRCDCQ